MKSGPPGTSDDLMDRVGAHVYATQVPREQVLFRELRREAPTLEHLFVQVMADAETGNPGPPRPPRLVRGNAA